MSLWKAIDNKLLVLSSWRHRLLYQKQKRNSWLFLTNWFKSAAEIVKMDTDNFYGKHKSSNTWQRPLIIWRTWIFLSTVILISGRIYVLTSLFLWWSLLGRRLLSDTTAWTKLASCGCHCRLSLVVWHAILDLGEWKSQRKAPLHRHIWPFSVLNLVPVYKVETLYRSSDIVPEYQREYI